MFQSNELLDMRIGVYMKDSGPQATDEAEWATRTGGGGPSCLGS